MSDHVHDCENCPLMTGCELPPAVEYREKNNIQLDPIMNEKFKKEAGEVFGSLEALARIISAMTGMPLMLARVYVLIHMKDQANKEQDAGERTGYERPFAEFGLRRPAREDSATESQPKPASATSSIPSFTLPEHIAQFLKVLEEKK